MNATISKKVSKPLLPLVSLLSLTLSTHLFAQEDECGISPVNPTSGNVQELKTALQNATNTGEPVVISGTYIIDEPIVVYVRNDLIIDAYSAHFEAAEGLNGDMFSLDVVKGKSNQCKKPSEGNASVEWRGGTFEFSKALNSTTVPIQSRVPDSRQGTQSTADAISIRGAYKDGPQLIDYALVEDVIMRGTIGENKTLFDAGGDSGVFMGSIKKGEVKNSEFFGIRDAAIYVSANNFDSAMRSEYILTGNVMKRVYDGISSKRGADAIVMRDNEITDSIVALSIKENIEGRLASFITIDNNTIDRSVRAILLENTRNSQITNNTIRNLGGDVANISNPLSGGGKYRGVTFEGLSGDDNVVSDNKFQGDTSSSQSKIANIIAVSSTALRGEENADIIRKNNTYNSAIGVRFVNE